MTDEYKNGKEQRKHERYSGLLVDYSVYRKEIVDPVEVSALTKNVSLGGMCIYISEPLEIGSFLYIKIYFPESKHPVEVKTEVRWQKSTGEFKQNTVGLEFKKFNDEGRDVLTKQIEALKKQESISADDEKNF